MFTSILAQILSSLLRSALAHSLPAAIILLSLVPIALLSSLFASATSHSSSNTSRSAIPSETSSSEHHLAAGKAAKYKKYAAAASTSGAPSSSSYLSNPNFSSGSLSSYFSTSTSILSTLPDISPFTILRTKSSHFQHIKNFNHPPRYFNLPNGIRVHYIDVYESKDTDKRKANAVLLLHGSTTWSYTYRHVITELLSQGYRVICLDFPGFGRSDKITTNEITLGLFTQTLSTFLTEVIKTSRSSQLTVVAHGFSTLVTFLTLRDCPMLHDIIQKVVILNGYFPPSHDEMTLHDIQKWFIALLSLHILKNFGQSRKQRLPFSKLVQYCVTPKTQKQSPPTEFKPYDSPYPSRQYQTTLTTLPFLYPLPIFTDPLVKRLVQLIPALRSIPIISSVVPSDNDIALERELRAAKVWMREWSSRGLTYLYEHEPLSDPLQPNSILSLSDIASIPPPLSPPPHSPTSVASDGLWMKSYVRSKSPARVHTTSLEGMNPTRIGRQGIDTKNTKDKTKAEEKWEFRNKKVSIVWGDQDDLFNIEYAEFWADLCEADLVVMTGCGHYPQEDNPKGLAEVIVQFCQQ
ncbi:Alpha/Beta hydrolase protein [Paraphysoderma sedebokerense]|nr:Alpha/Beta hydrolase protein [Paraphysoderma sedebokerense]